MEQDRVDRDFLTISEFGALYGITRQSVLARVKEGSIRAEKAGRLWLIPKCETKRGVWDVVRTKNSRYLVRRGKK